MDNRAIGVLDSGIGGLSIWREISLTLPNESTIYIADSKNCPYGAKNPQEIYQLSKKLVQFLIENNVKFIVLACNTITVSCLEKFRKEFPKTPIIGAVPVVKTASEKTKNKKIGILSTTQTAKSRYQKNLIQKFTKGCKVLNLGTDKLVSFVERGALRNKSLRKVLREELRPFIKEDIDTLALGCSHFPFLKWEMQRLLGSKVKIFDSAGAIARQVKRVLEANNKLAKGVKAKYDFYTTGDKDNFHKIFKSLMGYNKARKISVHSVW